jgi:hypothetical protein
LVRTLENPSRTNYLTKSRKQGIAIHDSLFAKELTMLDESLETQLEEIIQILIEQESVFHKRKRTRRETPNYWESTWGRMLLDPSLLDPSSFTAKKFRRRFRVPYPLSADVIMPLCREHGILRAARERIPLEFKILAACACGH